MNIEIPLFEGFDDLDAFGPFELLRNVEQAGGPFRVGLVQLGDAPTITTSHGVVLTDVRRMSTDPREVDLVVVPGGRWSDPALPAGVRAECARGDLPHALAALHAGGVRMASVCTGAMLLSAAGLLAGRPATTHAVAREDLRTAGAKVLDARVVDAGDIVTAAGVTSGLDLALWLVERELGARRGETGARGRLRAARRRVARGGRHGGGVSEAVACARPAA